MRKFLPLLFLLLLSFADYTSTVTDHISLTGTDAEINYDHSITASVSFDINNKYLISPSDPSAIKPGSRVKVCKDAPLTVKIDLDSSLTNIKSDVSVDVPNITPSCTGYSGSGYYGFNSQENINICGKVFYGSSSTKTEAFDYMLLKAGLDGNIKIGGSSFSSVPASRTIILSSPSILDIAVNIQGISITLVYTEGEYNMPFYKPYSTASDLSGSIIFEVLDPDSISLPVKLYPSSVTMNENEYTFDLKVKNTGSYAIEITDISSSNSQLSVSASTGQTIDPGATVTIPVTLKSTSTEEFTATVTLDYRTAEKICDQYVDGRASLIVNYYPPVVPLADLTPEADYTKDKDKVYINLVVKNIGDGNASNVYVKVQNTSPNSYSELIYIGDILAGKEKSIDLTYICQSVSDIIKVTFIVDPNNAIEESNEDNNEASLEISCERPLPDLTPEVDYTWGDNGTGTVNIDVGNYGDADAENVEVVAYISDSTGDRNDSRLIPLLKTGDVYSFEEAFVCDNSNDTVNVRVIVDPKNTIEEVNENNNEATLTIDCSERPLPDLTPSVGYSKEGEQVSISIKVSNTGKASASDILTYFYITNSTGTTSKSFTIPLLTPGQSYVFNESYFCDYSDELVKVKVVVDPNNAIEESNENNNQAEIVINCSSTTKPDLTPKIDYEWNEDDSVDLTVSVINEGDGSTGKSFDVEITINDEKEIHTVDPLNPGDSKKFEYTALCKDETDVIKVKVIADVENTIVESNEDNNEAYLEISCDRHRKCELDPTSLYFEDVTTKTSKLTCDGEVCDTVTLGPLTYYIATYVVEDSTYPPVGLIVVYPADETTTENEVLEVSATKKDERGDTIYYTCALPLSSNIEHLPDCRKRI